MARSCELSRKPRPDPPSNLSTARRLRRSVIAPCRLAIRTRRHSPSTATYLRICHEATQGALEKHGHHKRKLAYRLIAYRTKPKHESSLLTQGQVISHAQMASCRTQHFHLIRSPQYSKKRQSVNFRQPSYTACQAKTAAMIAGHRVGKKSMRAGKPKLFQPFQPAPPR